MTHHSEQEAFWAGEFGTEYIRRNQGDALLAANLNFFGRALARASDLQSCVEFGANIGMNLRALKLLYPTMQFEAAEINADAACELGNVIGPENVYCGSIVDFAPRTPASLALIKGVLIHLNPSLLSQVYDRLIASTQSWLLIAEYYNTTPVSIPYRGHTDRLFKRDFAGEILDRHPQMQLIDYGFAYHRDPQFPQDDITWFLLKSR